jgi:hypothetical protein
MASVGELIFITKGVTLYALEPMIEGLCLSSRHHWKIFAAERTHVHARERGGTFIKAIFSAHLHACGQVARQNTNDWQGHV